METQKQVKITGLTFHQDLGIIQAQKLTFDEDNKLIIFKGAVGEGKTTMQKALKLGTQGAKTLVDNELYGTTDLEVQLLDGEFPLWVGCKNKGKKLQYVLYTKDSSGKRVENPIIDGIKATPSDYLKTLQTELTWKMNELTSENPKVQKNILLKLYQSQLSKLGVIFDKKHPDYELSILGQIDKAVSSRDEKDMIRKQSGGIAEDLKAQGFDPDRPETCPDSINIEEIETAIKAIEKEKTTKEAAPEAAKKAELSEIKVKAGEVTNKCLTYNSELKAEYDKELKVYNQYLEKKEFIGNHLKLINDSLIALEYDESVFDYIIGKAPKLEEITEPKTPNYIKFKDNNVAESENLNQKGIDLICDIGTLRAEYVKKDSEKASVDTSDLTEKIDLQEQKKIQAKETNKIVDAIDSFHKWRHANIEVVRLKDEYLKMLAKVDTGVEGLQIIPDEDNIFLMYDGSYDVDYFHPKEKKLKMQKVAAYSGTQRHVICLLIQNYLLSKKPKAMRYMYIDDIPHDNKTRALLEKMSEELNLHIFLNWTGDFDKSQLKDGEILIQGGEIFF